MITPHPTTKIDPTLARGVLDAIVPPTATRAGYIVLSVPNTSYQLHLVPTAELSPGGVGKRLIGTIRAEAKRIDVVQSGGRYIEPVYGRPRRVQGAVVAIDEAAGGVVVNCGVPVLCIPTDGRQAAAQFEPGQFVSFDVLDGASFTPASGPAPAGGAHA